MKTQTCGEQIFFKHSIYDVEIMIRQYRENLMFTHCYTDIGRTEIFNYRVDELNDISGEFTNESLSTCMRCFCSIAKLLVKDRTTTLANLTNFTSKYLR